MGTGVIFYEELDEDMGQTWDFFDSIFRDMLRVRIYPSVEPFRYPMESIHFDPDYPYDYPLSLLHPDGGFLHPSPPPELYYTPPHGPLLPRYSLDPDQFEYPMVPPLSYYPPTYLPPADTGVIGEPYDPLDDFDGFIAQYFQDPQGDAVVPIEEDPREDPMEEDEVDEELSARLEAMIFPRPSCMTIASARGNTRSALKTHSLQSCRELLIPLVLLHGILSRILLYGYYCISLRILEILSDEPVEIIQLIVWLTNDPSVGWSR
ncbi:hypothetical protein PIB30_062154 [Stylosanthes scabra]|uniref:Uncharacterized protein n=1 Tax=Stylosanthes scabra TaxID=79078 RepID=A0ABU6VP82_9FABA|nr:hypothetical protein [Stylosanthes scabra]